MTRPPKTLLLLAALGGGALSAGSAAAQRPQVQSSPLPPLQQQWQQNGIAPVQQDPDPSGGSGSPDQAGPSDQNQGQTDQGQTDQAQPDPPPGDPATMPQRPNVWVPAKAVKLQALDKVNAESSALTIKVGQAATFGSLTITAKACVVRPADQPPDAAAYLSVTDSHPDSPGFNGWMLKTEPSVSMMEHPIYDLRVTGCT